MRTEFLARGSEHKPHPEEPAEGGRLEGWLQAWPCELWPKKSYPRLGIRPYPERATARVTRAALMRRRGEAGGPGSGAGDQASRTGVFAGRNPPRPVERREAQRFGGKASHAFRSPPARASGWVSQARPNGDSQNPFRQGATVFGGNAGHHRGAVAQRPWRLPALHFPRGKGKRDRRCPRRAKQPGGAALAN